MPKPIFERRGRDRLYIIAEILAITEYGSLKTPIMYRANLSFRQLNAYLSLLLERKLLKEVEKEGKTVYKATSNGMKVLEHYKEIFELLREPELESEKKTPLLEV